MVNAEKILIIGPSWVGDMVMAQSLFKVLKQQQPAAQIDVLAPGWCLPLLARMPEVNQALAMPLGHGQFQLRTRYQMGKQLRAAGYGQSMVLANSWKSALIPFFAAIPKRTGYLGECRWGLVNDIKPLDKQQLTMTVQRFVALADANQIPQPKLTVTPEQLTEVAAKFALSHQPLLALCPGAEYGEAKRWPAEHFAEIARQKQQQGWQIALFGSAKDAPICQTINQLTHELCLNLAGKTSLAEAVDLLALAEIVVSNDSGLMHVAAALQKNLIAIYGSSDPGFTPPLSDTAQIIRLNLACSPCFKRVCPLEHTQCLTEISPEQVLAAMSKFL